MAFKLSEQPLQRLQGGLSLIRLAAVTAEQHVDVGKRVANMFPLSTGALLRTDSCVRMLVFSIGLQPAPTPRCSVYPLVAQ